MSWRLCIVELLASIFGLFPRDFELIIIEVGWWVHGVLLLVSQLQCIFNISITKAEYHKINYLRECSASARFSIWIKVVTKGHISQYLSQLIMMLINSEGQLLKWLCTERNCAISHTLSYHQYSYIKYINTYNAALDIIFFNIFTHTQPKSTEIFSQVQIFPWNINKVTGLTLHLPMQVHNDLISLHHKINQKWAWWVWILVLILCRFLLWTYDFSRPQWGLDLSLLRTKEFYRMLQTKSF